MITVCSIDEILRESASAGLMCDLPTAVLIRHDLLPSRQLLRRVVCNQHGIVEDVLLPLEHSCLSCALREDIVPTVQRVAESQTGHPIVLALPVTAEPMPVLRALATSSGRGIEVAGVLSAFEGAELHRDLLGDDLLADRGLALAVDDRRAVGEVLSHQIESADVLLTPEPLHRQAAALLDHLVESPTLRALLHSLTPQHLLAARRAGPADTRGTCWR